MTLKERQSYIMLYWCGLHYFVIFFCYDPVLIAISISHLGLAVKELCEQP